MSALAYDDEVLGRLVGEYVGQRERRTRDEDGTVHTMREASGLAVMVYKRFKALKVFSVERAGHDGVHALCRKCGGQFDVRDLRVCPSYRVMVPEFDTCPVCEGESRDTGDWCERCKGKGFVVKRTWTVHVDLACSACVTEMRDGRGGRGHSPAYTTETHGGEFVPRVELRDVKNPRMCVGCQQRRPKSGMDVCGWCHHEEVRQLEKSRDLLRAELARERDAESPPIGMGFTYEPVWGVLRHANGTRLTHAWCDLDLPGQRRAAYGATRSGQILAAS